MKTKQIIAAAVATLGIAAATPASSAEFLFNYAINPNGTGFGGATTINEYLDIVGPSYVQTTTPTGTGAFTFTENGAFVTSTHDGGAAYPFTNQLTATLTNNTGFGSLVGGSVTYNPGGAIQLYSDTTADFATTNSIYGANNGTNFGTFEVVSGGGAIQPTGVPNGDQTIIARATALTAGYFFTDTGVDLSTLIGTGTDLLFGFVTVNASRVVNPTANVVGEIVGQLAGDATFTNCLPGEVSATCTTGAGEFVISNNGQFRLAVPEPTSIALFGAALALFGFTRRRQA